MSQPNKPDMADENRAFILACRQRGLLAPAVAPQPKLCLRCNQQFTGVSNMCRPCLIILYPSKPTPPDVYLDVCEVCLPQLKPRTDGSRPKTLHLGPGWCVRCNGVPGNEFPLICDECEIHEPLPVLVRDDRGGVVNLLEVETLWCERCEGQADSYCR